MYMCMCVFIYIKCIFIVSFVIVCVSGKNMVSKSSCESETFTGSGIGEIKDGVTVQASPPSAVSASGFTRVFSPWSTSPRYLIRCTAAYDTAQFNATTSSTSTANVTFDIPTRKYAFAKSPYVVMLFDER